MFLQVLLNSESDIQDIETVGGVEDHEVTRLNSESDIQDIETCRPYPERVLLRGQTVSPTFRT